MKICEFVKSTDHVHGTIAMLKPCAEDAEKLHKWCIDNDIPCIDTDKLHCTVLFSKEPVEHLVKHNNQTVTVKSTIKKWKKLGNALTLVLDAPIALKIHRYMRNQGGTHDFPSFIAHISVCYDCTDDKLPDVVPEFPITFDKLEVKPIDPDFAG